MKYRNYDCSETTECSICTQAFKEYEDVTPLPCNMAHCFHKSCITRWLITSPTCPICRASVTEEGFREL